MQGPLGFASGLPLLLTGSTLTARLAQAGVDIETIGLFALIALPYNFKFLWAAVLDRWQPPGAGWRRGWMLIFSLALVPALALLGTSDPLAPASVALLALAVASLSATLDVQVDAYRNDLLEGKARARHRALRDRLPAGHDRRRALSLLLSDYLAWDSIYLLMAGLLLASLPIILLAPSLPGEGMVAPSLFAALIRPLFEFFDRPGALWALLFIAFYKFGDALAVNLINPFLIGLEFSGTEIGLVQKGLGITATLVGVAAGGILLDRRDLLRCVLFFGITQAAANAGYVALALVGKSLPLFVVAAAVDHLCNGLGMAALLACLTALCDRRYTATQYALFTSASSVLGRVLGAGSGLLIAEFGWPASSVHDGGRGTGPVRGGTARARAQGGGCRVRSTEPFTIRRHAQQIGKPRSTRPHAMTLVRLLLATAPTTSAAAPIRNRIGTSGYHGTRNGRGSSGSRRRSTNTPITASA